MLWLAIVLPATAAEPIAVLLTQHARDQGFTGTEAYRDAKLFAGFMFVASGLSLVGTKVRFLAITTLRCGRRSQR